MVGGVETLIGSLRGSADQEWVGKWHADWNQLEYVNASMIDEERDVLTAEERGIVDDALEHLEHMARPWTQLGEFERAVLEKVTAGDAREMQLLREQAGTCVVRSRELTGVGFFTSLDVDRVSVAPVEGLPSPFGDVYAEIEGLAHGAGFLLWIKDGYIDALEGYSYDETWPEVTGAFTLLPWSQFEGKSATSPPPDA